MEGDPGYDAGNVLAKLDRDNRRTSAPR